MYESSHFEEDLEHISDRLNGSCRKESTNLRFPGGILAFFFPCGRSEPS